MPILATFKWFLGVRGVLLCGCAAAVYAQPFRPLVVVGESMTPTYHSGEITMTVPIRGEIRRGDIVVVDRPEGPIVKRVAMIPGDPMLQVRTFFGPWKDAFGMAHAGPQKKDRVRYVPVPEGTVYVLGDNLQGSSDSRSFGPVSVTQISRKVYRPRPGGPGDDFVAVKTYRQMRTW